MLPARRPCKEYGRIVNDSPFTVFCRRHIGLLCAVGLSICVLVIIVYNIGIAAGRALK